MAQSAATKRPVRKARPDAAKSAPATDPVDHFRQAALAAFRARQIPWAEEGAAERVLGESAFFAIPSSDSADLLVTAESLFLAMMIVGSARPVVREPPEWLVMWIASRVREPDRDVANMALGAGNLEHTLGQGGSIRLAPDTEELLEGATRFARAVEGGPSPRVDLRHLTALLLMPGGAFEHFARQFSWLDDAGLERTRQEYLSWVIQALPESDIRQRWHRAFQALPDLPAAPSGPPVVSIFSSDRPEADLDGPDPLRIDKDVTAFARLIAHQQMGTPLAIGVFGPWGSGKSSFMERLEKAIDRLADPRRRNAGQDGFVSSVVHVRFNAWSFADANLWASLGAEFFDQLRVGGHSKVGSDVHAELVERVTTHVHDLKSTAEATRAVANEGERALADAQRARDKAVKDARDAPASALTQGLLDGMAKAHEAFKGELGHSEDDLGRLVKTARSVQSAAGRGKTAARELFRGGPRTVWPLVAFAASLAAGYAFYRWAPASWFGWLGRDPTALLTALAPGVAAYLAAFGSGLRVAKRFALETAAFARQLKAADATVLADVLKAELALKEAASEAEARRKAAERATRALARYIDPKGTSNPPRLLRYVLEDDPATRSLEKEIGLISRTRRLFEAVDLILREERRKRALDLIADHDVPERIIIYIDDLDRCTQEQVQSVLQAVHLLLAFESFVVVVGVDQTRVAEALARQFDSDENPENDTADEMMRRMERAVHYLEKIFQLAFRLKPLSPGGSDGGAYGRFVMQIAGAPPGSPPDAEAASKTPAPSGATPTAVAPSDAPKAAATPPTERASPAEAKQALATLILDPAEARFLASAAIGAVAGDTPRNVKRMINVYRLARVRLAEEGFDVIGGSGPPLYPLLALFAAIDTGRKPQVAKRVFDALGADATPLDAVVRNALSAADTELVSRAICDAFGRMPTAKDCRPVADLVRRYSFNALDD